MADNEKYACGYKNSQTGEIVYYKDKDARSQLKDIANNKADKSSISFLDYEGNNDTEKLKNLINDINNNYKTKNIKIEIPYDITINEDIIIDSWSNKNIEINGAIYFNNCNAFIFKRLSNSKIFINSIKGSDNISVDEINNLTKEGICLSSCFYNDVYINYIYGFKNGLILEGKDYSDNLIKGSYGNKISFKNINRVQDAILLRSINNGWVNENIICNGSMDCINGIVQGDSNATGTTTCNFHNNKFLFLIFEQIRGGSAIVFNEGRSNAVLYPRFEGDGNPISQLIIKEGDGACSNAYITSEYTIYLEQIQLNKNGISGSYVTADIRTNTGAILCNKIKAFNGSYIYESDNLNENSKNNTFVVEYNDEYLFSYKDSSGNIKKLGYYNSPVKVSNENLKNNFVNFAGDENSEYPFLNYYITGNNEVCVSGVLKGGTDNSIIYTLPPQYRPSKDHMFPIYIKHNLDGEKVGFINITSGGNIYFQGEVSGINRFYLDGIRYKIDY